MPLAKKSKPEVVYTSSTSTIVTFGGTQQPLPSALAYVDDYGANIAHLVYPPSDPNHPGFRYIELLPNEYNLEVDGVLVTPGKAVGMYSRDCPIVFLMDTKRNEGLLLHCGRPAMSPSRYENDKSYTVITAALNTLISRGSAISDLIVVITAGICGPCFTHNLAKDHHLIRPFFEQFPYHVDLETGSIDIIGVITSQLVAAGIDREEIKHDGYCTKEHPRLTSKRGGDMDSNLVVAFITK